MDSFSKEDYSDQKKRQTVRTPDSAALRLAQSGRLGSSFLRSNHFPNAVPGIENYIVVCRREREKGEEERAYSS